MNFPVWQLNPEDQETLRRIRERAESMPIQYRFLWKSKESQQHPIEEHGSHGFLFNGNVRVSFCIEQHDRDTARHVKVRSQEGAVRIHILCCTEILINLGFEKDPSGMPGFTLQHIWNDSADEEALHAIQVAKIQI